MFPWQMNDFNKFIKDFLTKNSMDIEGYVKDVVSQAIPTDFSNENFNDMSKRSENEQSVEQKLKQKLASNVFETHDDVYVQVYIRNKADLENMKLYYTSNQVIIKDVPKIGDEQVIILPAIVKKKGAKTNYKNGILQIKIPKNDDMQFTELDVQF